MARHGGQPLRVPSRIFLLVLLAVLFTLLNAVKPLHIDDPAYYCYAAHIAEYPLDPYGFTILWEGKPRPAFQVLAPPLVPYWWAAASRLFGDSPLLWKVWFFPFNLLLVSALYQLFRRFARGLEMLLTWMTALSPAILPGCNLMLDVPALGLGLGAVAAFFGACDRNSFARAALAGLLAGLALETKYTAVLVPAVMVLFGLLCRRPRLGLFAAGMAVLGFAAWEATMAQIYGQSHFFYHCGSHRQALLRNPSPLLSLITLLGGVAPAATLLALVALDVRRRWVMAAAGVVVLGYGLLMGLGESASTTIHWQWPGPVAPVLHVRFAPDSVIFEVLGLLFWGVLAAVAWRLCFKRASGGRKPPDGALRIKGLTSPARLQPTEDWFLVLWLVLEIVGYFVLTPYPAVRRVMGISVVAALLVGRLAVRYRGSADHLRWVRAAVLSGVGLGLAFYGVDLRDAIAEKQAVEHAAELLRRPHGQVWCVGYWGFQYYAERAGMKPVVPGTSQLRKGDLLVVPDKRLGQQPLAINSNATLLVHQFSIDDPLPVRTVAGYYGSRIPLEPCPGARVVVVIYRVTAAFVPADRS
jgi:hypothetical protein